MASQVVAFLRRSRRGTDWSQEEIAELYRIEHALLQARFSLETDRGVSDEGDPWFVFCRADGEVFVHITRSDEGYLLYGLGLPRPLTGRVIGDISKSFVNQIPLNIPRQTDGPRLFVHPAATLAIIVGMIFLANDDISLVARSDETDVASASDSAEPADRAVKASVLAVLSKLTDGTLFGNARHDANHQANHQEGNYLNIVCTIAAVMMGTSVALDSGDGDFAQFAAGSDPAVAAAEPEHAQAPSTVPIDSEFAMQVDLSVGDPLSADHAADASSFVALPDDAQVADTISSSTIVETAYKIRQQQPDVDPGAVLDHEKTSLTGDTVVFDQPRPNIQAETSHSSVATTASDPAPETAKPAASSSALLSSTARHEEAGATSADDGFQHFLKSVGLADNAQPDRVLSTASAEILQSIPLPVAAAEPVRADVTDDGPQAETALGKLYPLFDNGVLEYLTSFLQAHPQSEAYFYDHNVVVYDGQKDFAAKPVTVQVWEFDSGATIAIVGHNDFPLYHA